MPNSLIFIDNRISNRTELLKQLPSDSRIIELNATQDGLQQIADAVSAYRNLDSIHLISHGSAGALYLGNSVLNSQTLPNYSAALNTIGNSLSSTGDMLLYGCNVAEGETGAAFIAQLAQATGTDVAASTDITGQGGDWDLEAQQGTIESQALELKGVEALGERDFTILSQGSGIVITDLGGSEYGNSLSLQADGKILLGGYTYSNRSSNFALVRYNADGSLDTSFSGDGMLTTDLGGDDVGRSLSLQADGKILLGGYSGGNFALVRYNADGSLDTSFSGDGMLTTDLGGDDVGRSLSLQADGKILLGGYTYSNGLRNFALVRYNTDGSLDTSFSGDGMLTTDLGGDDVGNSLSLQADGKILLGGHAESSSSEGFALVRYNTDGSLDTSFSGDGILITDLGRYDYGKSLSLQADGKILLGGYSSYSDSSFALVRYNTDGSLDTSFSGYGKLNTYLGDDSYGNSLSLQADGKILLGGYRDGDFALVRYNTDGRLDTSFSGDGKLTTDLGGNDVGNSLSLQADGKILLGGTSNGNFALVRYNVDGSLDSSFSAAITGSLAVTGTATQAQVLTATNAVIDPNGINSNTLHYQWLADGQAISGATDNTFALTQAQVGKTISLQLDYTDSVGLNKSLLSTATLAVTNINDAPTGSLTISGTATQNQTLTATSTLADVDGLGTVAYQWLADGVAIEGETTTSLALTQALVGKAISVQASYTDGFGMAESVTSAATRTVVNVNDAPSGSVTISGIAAQNETLTASNTLADDADGMGVISYQWLANGRVISGATGETLTLTQAQVGKAISVQASYTDGQNTLERITSTATQAITNVNDAPTGSVAISGTATQGRTLTATNTLADADGMGALAYQWLADGVVINGATARTLQLTQNQVNQAISVQIRYTDSQGTVETISSSATTGVQNINDAPTGQLNISGLIREDALIGHELSAISTLADTDGLGTFSYQWLANGAVIRDATNSTFTPTILQQGKQITVKVQYTDAFGTREIIQSAAVSSTADMQYGDSVRVGSNDRLQGGIFASDLYGYSGNDELHGGAGEDRLYGGYGDDLLYGEADNDELEGDQGNDKIYGDAGNDTLTGGTGKDSLYGGDGNDVLDGSSDIDFMDGGNGADTYYVDNKGDIVRDSGTDSAKDVLYITAYLQGGYVLGAGIDNAVLSALANNAALTGNAGNNTLTGNTSANNLKGGVGIDTLKGGAGNDTLIGGAGKDVLNGGTGKDIFKLEKLIESGVTAAERDVVQGFVRGQDKLGLSALDANTAVAGDQSFDTIISKSATFTQAGQLQLKEGILYGNTDADVGAEFSIALTGITTLTLADIIA